MCIREVGIQFSDCAVSNIQVLFRSVGKWRWWWWWRCEVRPDAKNLRSSSPSSREPSSKASYLPYHNIYSTPDLPLGEIIPSSPQKSPPIPFLNSFAFGSHLVSVVVVKFSHTTQLSMLPQISTDRILSARSMVCFPIYPAESELRKSSNQIKHHGEYRWRGRENSTSVPILSSSPSPNACYLVR